MPRNFSSLLGLTLLSVALISGCTSTGPPTDKEAEPALKQSETQQPDVTPDTSMDEQEIAEAMKAAETYKTKEYTIDEIPETPLEDEAMMKRLAEMEPLYADNYTDKPGNTSYGVLTFRIASVQQVSMKPENLTFELYQEAENYVDFDYTVDLILTRQNGESERLPLEGRLTLVRKNGKWLVQADEIDPDFGNQVITQR
ncbi:hypothetical protein MKY59_04580 [Paenibacillus sp. FSL W8-0426]|uniref:hypothetical protein n=1 Tax=Paenibacillus sp. FSL W8-0426 TaxID=2921714 RepID=UPI0030DB3562